MKLKSRIGTVPILGIGLLAAGFCQMAPRFFELGDFVLENGSVIRDCRIEFRVFGALNASKSNAVLFPTWFSGTTEHLAALIGPGNLLDSTAFCVIAVGALGNGISASPSNSTRQPGLEFPRFTIRDMVATQQRLLIERFGLTHVHALVGGSMGGMQVLEWLVRYPDFMTRAVAYVGSPRLTSYDLLQCQAMLEAITSGWECGKSEPEIARSVALIQNLVAYTPDRRLSQTSREQFPQYISGYIENFTGKFNSFNWHHQLLAMQSHDIYQPFEASRELAASRVRAEVLIIVSKTDHMVHPAPALELAPLIEAELILLDNDCGHLAPACEWERFVGAVDGFLKKP